jgi:uncharacterized protein with FMN-binding domain
MMKKIIVSTSLVLVFSIYILFTTPDVMPVAASLPTASSSSTVKEAITANAAPPSVPSAIATAPVAIAQKPRVSTPPVQQKPPVSAPPQPQPVKPTGLYKDGVYTGPVADAYYGNVQVQATIAGGKLTDVAFLQYPNDRSNSRAINGHAMPYLTQEAIQAQNASVDIVSGATDTSMAFQQSLGAALAQAKNSA